MEPMTIDVSRYLTYSVTVTPKTGDDGTGEPLYDTTGTSGIKCWFEPTVRRWFGPNGEAKETTDVSVLFLPTQTINVGDKLTNLTDVFGNVVLASGVVTDIAPSYHPVDGQKLKDCSVKKGSVG